MMEEIHPDGLSYIKEQIAELKSGARIKAAILSSALMILAPAVSVYFANRLGSEEKAGLQRLVDQTTIMLEDYKQAASSAKRVASEAEDILLTLGDVRNIEDKLDNAMDDLDRVEKGFMPRARKAAEEIQEHEQRARAVTIALDELESDYGAIREQIEANNENIMVAESRLDELVTAASEELKSTNAEIRENLSIALGQRQRRESGVVQHSEAPGLVLGYLDASTKLKRPKTGLGICCYVGEQHLVQERKGTKMAAYVNPKSGSLKASLLIPVRRGDYWLVTNCSTLKEDSILTEVYWTELHLDFSSGE